MRHEQLTVGELTVNKVNGVVVGPAVSGITSVNGTKAPVFSGVSAAENDADASVAITVAGVLATDVATAVMVAGATPQAVTKVVCTANTVTVTLAGNGGVGTQVFYTVYR